MIVFTTAELKAWLLADQRRPMLVEFLDQPTQSKFLTLTQGQLVLHSPEENIDLQGQYAIQPEVIYISWLNEDNWQVEGIPDAVARFTKARLNVSRDIDLMSPDLFSQFMYESNQFIERAIQSSERLNSQSPYTWKLEQQTNDSVFPYTYTLYFSEQDNHTIRAVDLQALIRHMQSR